MGESGNPVSGLVPQRFWHFLAPLSLSFPICKIAMLTLLGRHTCRVFMEPNEMVLAEVLDTSQSILSWKGHRPLCASPALGRSTIELSAWHLGDAYNVET